MNSKPSFIPDEDPVSYAAIDAEHAAQQLQLRQMVRALCDIDSGLSPWEVDFVEAMSHRNDDFTPGQAEKIEELFDRRC